MQCEYLDTVIKYIYIHNSFVPLLFRGHWSTKTELHLCMWGHLRLLPIIPMNIHLGSIPMKDMGKSKFPLKLIPNFNI